MRYGLFVMIFAMFGFAAVSQGDTLFFEGGGGSYHSSGTTASESDKGGNLYRVEAVYERPKNNFDLHLGVGGGLLSVTGENKHIKQKITQSSLLLDVAGYYRLPWWGIALGVGIDSLVGQGSYLDYSSPNAMQAALFVSPRIKVSKAVGKVVLTGVLQYDISTNLSASRARNFMGMVGAGIPIGAQAVQPPKETPPIAAPSEPAEPSVPLAPVKSAAPVKTAEPPGVVAPPAVPPAKPVPPPKHAAPNTTIIVPPAAVVPPAAALTPPAALVRATIPAKKMTTSAIALDDKRVAFSHNSAHMSAKSQALLIKIGKYLVANNNKWSKLQIISCLVDQGQPTVNQKLTTARALAVRDVLMMAGVAKEKLEYSANVVQGHKSERHTELILAGDREIWSKFREIKTH